MEKTYRSWEDIPPNSLFVAYSLDVHSFCFFHKKADVPEGGPQFDRSTTSDGIWYPCGAQDPQFPVNAAFVRENKGKLIKGSGLENFVYATKIRILPFLLGRR